MTKKRLYLDKNLQIIFAVTLMAILGVSSITPVFPKVMSELNITATQVGLLITSFTLPGVILSLFLGVLIDRMGRKRMLVPSLFLFGIAGTACAFTRDFTTMLVFRGFQGIGAAGLGIIATTLVGDLYSGKERAEAMGLNASVLSIGTASYPTIGGALAILGWHYPFALPIIAIPIAIIVILFLRNPEPRNIQSLKGYLGGTWSHLKNFKVIVLFAAGVLTFFVLYGAYLTYFPLLLDGYFGASSLTIGIIMSAMSLTTAAVSSQLGRISKWLSLETIIKLAFAAYALGLFLIPFMPGLWLMLIPILFLGLGHGVNIPSLQTALAEIAPLEFRAAFMSVNGTMLRIGQTIGPPLFAIIYLYGGLKATFLAASGLAILLPITAIVLSQIKNFNNLKADETG